MRYFVVFFFILFAKNIVFSQETNPSQKVFGTIVNYSSQLPLANVNIININKVKGTVSDSNGKFELEVSVTDTLHISLIGFKSIKIRVTNDWFKIKTTKII